MSAVFILLLVGVLLLAIELVVPGVIIGAVGAVLMLAGVVLAFGEFGMAGGLYTLGGVILVLSAVIYIELVWLPKSALARWLSMSTTLTAKSQPPVAEPSVIGAEAVADTMLNPSGYVRMNGRRYEAFCRDGQAPAGATLRVVGLDNFRLIVTLAP